MTLKEKSIFKQGIAVGYKKAMQKFNKAYKESQISSFQLGLDSQNTKQIDTWLESELTKLDKIFK